MHGRWVVDAATLTGVGPIPGSQLPASFVCFDATKCLYSSYVGDVRSGSVEEYESRWIQDGDSALTGHGREWTYFPASRRIRTSDGVVEVSFSRASPETWEKVLHAQLKTAAGVGKQTAQRLASRGVRFADIRAWDDEAVERWATDVQARVVVLRALRDDLNRRLCSAPNNRHRGPE